LRDHLLELPRPLCLFSPPLLLLQPTPLALPVFAHSTLSCATSAFDDYAAKGTDNVDRKLIEDDIKLLTKTGCAVKDFVDERVAHYDKAHARPDELAELTAPTFKELTDALDLLGTLLKKYYRLLTGATLGSAEPVPQMSWTHPFTVAGMPIEEE
jgi:hypothetical protein